MKKILYLYFILSAAAYNAQVSLSGTVKNKSNGDPIPGVVIYFPDLRTGAVSKVDGTYTLNNLPAVKTLVQARLFGFKNVIQPIDLRTNDRLDFIMEESVIEENEIVVTGVSKASSFRSNPLPMLFLDREHLENLNGSNLIDGLTKVPGLNAIATGANVSKPVIRGLGTNRVLLLFDGIRQESQQWGEEHSMEIDQYLISRVEIVKGPASLLYGSDALGGVVNFLPALPLPEGKVEGEVKGEYHTNNGLRGITFGLSGNEKGFNWGLRASQRTAMDYRNPIDGRVFNSGFSEGNLHAFFGVNKSWGFTHLAISSYDNFQEIPGGDRDSATRQFTKPLDEEGTMEIVPGDELNSYETNLIHQRIQHYRVFSNSNFLIRQNRLDLKLGYQRSLRNEYSHPLAAEIPGLSLGLETGSYDVKFHFPEKNTWDILVGINGMYQQNRNLDATEFLIPNYNLFDFAPFFYLNKKAGPLEVAFGLRYDTRKFSNDALFTMVDPFTGFEKQIENSSANQVFSEFSANYQGLSGSIGASYRLNKLFTLKANVSRGFRAPNSSELAAQGVHPGSGFKQVGDLNLDPEFSLQGDLGIFFDSEHISAAGEVFYNHISDYIYNSKVGSLLGGDSIYTEGANEYPVYKTVQTQARLYGGEARIDIHPHPLDWLHFENSVSMVYGDNLENKGQSTEGQYLPFIPPFHSYSELRAELPMKKYLFSALFVKVGYQFYGAQERFFALDNTETFTDAYSLLDLGIGSTLVTKKNKTILNWSVNVSNVMDIAYQSHLSRLKYFEPYPSQTRQYSGIYNMGRNVSFRITLPIGINKQASVN